MTVVWQSPVPSSSYLQGVSCNLLPQRGCVLSFSYEQDNGRQTTEIRFGDIASYKCTYLYGLTADMINSAYDELIDMGITPWLSEIQEVMRRRGSDTSKLRHFRICFDDGPCYEFICTSVDVSEKGSDT